MNKNTKLRCKNCGHKETLANVTESMNTKILIAQVPRVREKDGLDIYPLLCLKCNYVTEWASDPLNESKKASLWLGCPPNASIADMLKAVVW